MDPQSCCIIYIKGLRSNKRESSFCRTIAPGHLNDSTLLHVAHWPLHHQTSKITQEYYNTSGYKFSEISLFILACLLPCAESCPCAQLVCGRLSVFLLLHTRVRTNKNQTARPFPRTDIQIPFTQEPGHIFDHRQPCDHGCR